MSWMRSPSFPTIQPMSDAGRRNLVDHIRETDEARPAPTVLDWIAAIIIVTIAMGAWFL